MDNKRKTNRELIKNYLNIIDANSFEVLGFLQDLSTKGIRIKSHKKLILLKNYVLSIKLSKNINNSDIIILTASCVWSKPDNESYINGFIIEHISEDNLILLQKLINDLS